MTAFAFCMLAMTDGGLAAVSSLVTGFSVVVVVGMSIISSTLNSPGVSTVDRRQTTNSFKSHNFYTIQVHITPPMH